MERALEKIKFTELLQCDVKRLTRPRFQHEFTQFNDRMAFSRMSGEPEPQTADLFSFDTPAAGQDEPKKSI